MPSNKSALGSGPARAKPCIQVENVFKSYDDLQAVDGLDFVVNCGEIFGLLGPNGAGKTSTIRMMLQMITPDGGNVKIFGQPFSEKAKEFIGYLPEERGLYERLTVRENLEYISSLKGADPEMADKKIVNLLHKVGLLDFMDKRVSILSKGMKQLVQLVATLAHNPKLLVLDEPFSGLDPANRELVKKIILEERKKGKTIILSTHLMEEVEALCDRILVVSKGRRILYGDVAEIKARYARHSIYVEFDGKFPKLEGVDRQDLKTTSVELFLRVDTDPQNIFRQLAKSTAKIRRFDVREMSLDQIFVQLVEAEKKWEKF